MSLGHLKEILRKVTIFSGIDDDVFDRYFSEKDVSGIEAGTILIHEGGDADHIYILLEGRCKVVLNYDEEPLELLEVGPGKVVGEASVIGIQKHSATVIAITPVEYFILSRKTLLTIHNTDPELFGRLILNIARELARRLAASNRIILDLQMRLAGG